MHGLEIAAEKPERPPGWDPDGLVALLTQLTYVRRLLSRRMERLVPFRKLPAFTCVKIGDSDTVVPSSHEYPRSTHGRAALVMATSVCAVRAVVM